MKNNNNIVKIISETVPTDWFSPYKTMENEEGTGTGFFISNNLILTCAHVVDESVRIFFTVPGLGRKKKEARVIGICYKKDIALLETKDYLSSEYLELGDSDSINDEDEVITIGYPLGMNVKRTKGIISGIQEEYIQTDAPINPGNSGGPLLDKNNKVVGINSAKISSDVADNIGYSIPINSYKVVEEALKNKQKVIVDIPSFVCDFNNSDEYLLKYMEAPESCKEGYFVKNVYKTSPFFGILSNGDILCSFDNYDVDNYGECIVPWSSNKIHLNYLLHRYKIGDRVQITYWSYKTFLKTKQVDIKSASIYFEDKKYYKLNFLYPPFDVIDYEIFGGMIFTNLTINHIKNMDKSNFSIKNIINLRSYLNKKKRMKNRILLTNLLGGSYIKSLNILQNGDIIKRINGIKVRTINDLRIAISKPIIKNNIKYISVKTKNNTLVILKLSKIVEEEQILSKQYKYNISTLFQKNDITDLKNKNISYKLII